MLTLRRSSSSRCSSWITVVVDAASCVVPVPVVSVPGSAEVVDAASCVVPVPVVSVPGSTVVVDAASSSFPFQSLQCLDRQKW